MIDECSHGRSSEFGRQACQDIRKNSTVNKRNSATRVLGEKAKSTRRWTCSRRVRVVRPRFFDLTSRQRVKPPCKLVIKMSTNARQMAIPLDRPSGGLVIMRGRLVRWFYVSPFRTSTRQGPVYRIATDRARADAQACAGSNVESELSCGQALLSRPNLKRRAQDGSRSAREEPEKRGRCGLAAAEDSGDDRRRSTPGNRKGLYRSRSRTQPRPSCRCRDPVNTFVERRRQKEHGRVGQAAWRRDRRPGAG